MHRRINLNSCVTALIGSWFGGELCSNTIVRSWFGGELWSISNTTIGSWFEVELCNIELIWCLSNNFETRITNTCLSYVIIDVYFFMVVVYEFAFAYLDYFHGIHPTPPIRYKVTMSTKARIDSKDYLVFFLSWVGFELDTWWLSTTSLTPKSHPWVQWCIVL